MSEPFKNKLLIMLVYFQHVGSVLLLLLMFSFLLLLGILFLQFYLLHCLLKCFNAESNKVI